MDGGKNLFPHFCNFRKYRLPFLAQSQYDGFAVRWLKKKIKETGSNIQPQMSLTEYGQRRVKCV
jgi:hypothetical protein